MAFNIASISSFIDENSYELISKAVLETDLSPFFNVRPGLESKSVDIPVMENDFVVQDGDSCGFNASGATTFTQLPMKISNLKVNMDFCPQTLRDTFLSKAMSSGALQESLSFEELLANDLVARLQKKNEEIICQGYGTNPGIEDLIVTGNGAVKIAKSTWTSSNAITKATAMYTAMTGDTQLRDDLVLIVSPSTYKTIKVALVEQNLYHYAPQMNGSGDTQRLFIPGIDVEVAATSGLSDSDRKYLGSRRDLYMGTSLTSDFEQFRLFYDQGEDIVKGMFRWRLGIQINNKNGWVYEA